MFTDVLDLIDEFLYKNSGATALSLRYRYSKDDFSFFQPFEGFEDFSYRCVSILAAPIFLSALALGHAMCALFYGLKSLCFDLPCGDMEACIDGLAIFVGRLPACIIMFVAALVSPLVNVVDLMGGVISSSIDLEDEEDDDTLDVLTSVP